MEHRLRLSICIVAFNEEKHLPKLLQNLKDQKYPHELIEIVLVDGESTDNTKPVMEQFVEEQHDFYRVVALNNPQRIQACGWNIAIRNSTGDVISRIDAHTMLPSEFSLLVMNEIEQGENVVGGMRPCII